MNVIEEIDYDLFVPLKCNSYYGSAIDYKNMILETREVGIHRF